MPEAALGNLIPGYGKPQMLSPLEAARYAQFVEMNIEAKEKGWLPASVVNLLPMSLNPPCVLLNGLKIPGVAVAEERWALSKKLKLRGGLEIPYVHHVITHPEFNVLEAVTGTDTNSFQATVKNKTWWPIALAKDIVLCSDLNQDRGGTFCYLGGHIPMDPHVKRESSMLTVEEEQELFESSYVRMIKFLTARFDFASGAFASKSIIDIKNVRDGERSATRYLRRVGVLEIDPEWFTRILTTQDRAPVKCAQCDADCSRHAVRCTAQGCGYWLKPYEAFMKGMFDLDTPGAITTLRRCTKEQLVNLGIYPRVKPLAEYIKDQTGGDEGEARSVDESKGKLGRGTQKAS
jgi:hypothetical protein